MELGGVKVWEPAELAWAAGFLDGEGHFAIRKQGWCPSIEASQVADRRPIDRLQGILGGVVMEKSRPKLGRPLYRWSLSGAPNIIRVLPMLMLYLVRKHEEAGLLWLAAAYTPPLGTNRLTDIERHAREETRLALLRLRETYSYAF